MFGHATLAGHAGRYSGEAHRLPAIFTSFVKNQGNGRLVHIRVPPGLDLDPAQVTIPPLDPASGALPLGRFPADLSEVEGRFVRDGLYTASTTRSEIWGHLLLAHQALDQLLPVYALWLGGSFLTSKVDPDDLDLLWLVDAAGYGSLSPQDQAVVSLFGTKDALRQRTGWRIDSFLLYWRPIPEPIYGDPSQFGYFWARGHWDDFWLRVRQSPKGVAPAERDTIPRRGYVEVTLRDYLQP